MAAVAGTLETGKLGTITSTSLRMVGQCAVQTHSMSTAIIGITISDRRDFKSSRLIGCLPKGYMTSGDSGLAIMIAGDFDLVALLIEVSGG